MPGLVERLAGRVGPEGLAAILTLIVVILAAAVIVALLAAGR